MTADKYVPDEEQVRAWCREGTGDYPDVMDGWITRFLARVRRDAAGEAEAERDEWRQTALDERAAALDALEQITVRDARISHLEDTARVLVKEVLKAEAGRDSARGYISELETAVQSRNDVIKHRDARIKAVRDIHTPEKHSSRDGDGAICQECLYGDGYSVKYPCPTIRALDGDA